MDTTPNYGEFNYGFHPNPDAEGLNAFSSPKLEERKAIIMIIYIILAFFSFTLITAMAEIKWNRVKEAVLTFAI